MMLLLPSNGSLHSLPNDVLCAEAVRLFYMQVCLNNGLPFEVKIPNKKTIKALRDADKRKTHQAKSVNKLFEDLG